ncbi:MAG: hypothetical protein KC492_39945 [Myxococcales bacterium]|nr:hypothetical protein [Myxococcales bacterium]
MATRVALKREFPRHCGGEAAAVPSLSQSRSSLGCLMRVKQFWPGILLLVLGCTRPATAPELPSQVDLLPPGQMRAYCDLDPDALCKDFVEVPRAAVQAFELRLGERMTQRHLARLTPKIGGYKRRYYAYRVAGRVIVEGFFVCAGTAAPVEAMSEDDAGESLVLSVDDAADCAVSVRFYADKPLQLDAEEPRRGSPRRGSE